MTPQVVFLRIAAALGIGAGLGLIYDLLRPLRPRHTLLADGLFLPAAFYGWLELSFRVCQADIRLGYSAAMALGWVLWQAVPGRWIRPVIFRLWGLQCRILATVTRPVKKTFKKSLIFAKSSLHSQRNGLQ